MGFWWKPKRFVALAIEKSRAVSSAMLVVALTLSMAFFGAITPNENATAAAVQCPADTGGAVYSYSAPNCTATFTTVQANSWTAPTGTTSVSVVVSGAQGGGSAGLGGRVSGVLAVTPGATYSIYVGGAGGTGSGAAGGFNGGGSWQTTWACRWSSTPQ